MNLTEVLLLDIHILIAPTTSYGWPFDFSKATLMVLNLRFAHQSESKSHYHSSSHHYIYDLTRSSLLFFHLKNIEPEQNIILLDMGWHKFWDRNWATSYFNASMLEKDSKMGLISLNTFRVPFKAPNIIELKYWSDIVKWALKCGFVYC